MAIDYSVILAYIFGIIFLFVIGRILLVPMKIVLKFIYNALIGGIILLGINFIGNLVGFNIALNIVTALVVGILGLPGIILLVILKFLFNT